MKRTHTTPVPPEDNDRPDACQAREVADVADAPMSRPTPDRRWLLAYDWDLVRQGTLLIPSEGG